MDLRRHRWALRAAVMFFVGVIPAILLFLLLTLVAMPLSSFFAELVIWFAVVAALALLGVVGLWGAAFRNEQERALPNAIVIPLILCGLLVALPYLYGSALDALEDGGFFLALTVLLLGPVACAVYFLVEQLVLTVRRRACI
ncbi:hypothetical protein ACFPN2_14445 [Steroidobacter flavus]|uniref:Transmembrane protein n=1 Tax=Steroidobacter flavus TaxID=1842136 RepID=A0ABV8SV12_9GAMM